MQGIILLIILVEIALLYRELVELREKTETYSEKIETYSEKTNGFITQLCDVIDQNSAMEEKILNEIAERLKERGNE
jgi:hypothetical protein